MLRAQDSSDYFEYGEDGHGSFSTPRSLLPHGKGVDWFKTSFLVMAMIVGTGVLDLPQNFAKVGWAPALASLVLGGLSSLISGLLIKV